MKMNPFFLTIVSEVFVSHSICCFSDQHVFWSDLPICYGWYTALQFCENLLSGCTLIESVNEANRVWLGVLVTEQGLAIFCYVFAPYPKGCFIS